MPPKAKKKPQVPAWFNVKQEARAAIKVRDALATYIVNEGLTDSKPTPCVELCRDILPLMAERETKWLLVTKANFCPTQYAAHKWFEDTIRNALNSSKALDLMIEDKVNALKEARAAEEEEQYEEEEEADEEQPDPDDQEAISDSEDNDEKVSIRSREITPRKRDDLVDTVMVGIKRDRPDHRDDDDSEIDPAMQAKLKKLKRYHKKWYLHTLRAQQYENSYNQLKNMIEFINSPFNKVGSAT